MCYSFSIMPRRIKREDLEGSINVQDADITPITRRKIETVDASDWSDLSIAELTDQLVTLTQRLTWANMYSPGMVLPIRKGIARLEFIIKEKQYEDTSLI